MSISNVDIAAAVAYNVSTTFDSVSRNTFLHQVTIETSTVPDAGTMSPQVRYTKTSAWEVPVDINGDDIVISLIEPKSFTISAWISGIRFVPTSLDSDVTYTVTVIHGV